MTILVTGSAGFIGSQLVLKLLELGYEVVGMDNLNDYYDPKLKLSRLDRFLKHKNYSHHQIDLIQDKKIAQLFSQYKPKIVVNLAAQAGVRYSLKNPQSFINSNIVGFGNILESSRINNVEHLIYASSSSVYGANLKLPYSTSDNVNHPKSLYAATKKSNELMAHSYSSLYGLPCTGLRFFTVYGPWDRPDMALQKFAHSIMNNKTIKIFNNGNHKRDFTYIDDIIECLIRLIKIKSLPNPKWSGSDPRPSSSYAPWNLYNIGNNRPTSLIDYIDQLEINLGKIAKKEYLPMQPGDVLETWADTEDLEKKINYKPLVTVEEGIRKFVNWFKSYY